MIKPSCQCAPCVMTSSFSTLHTQTCNISNKWRWWRWWWWGRQRRWKWPVIMLSSLLLLYPYGSMPLIFGGSICCLFFLFFFFFSSSTPFCAALLYPPPWCVVSVYRCSLSLCYTTRKKSRRRRRIPKGLIDERQLRKKKKKKSTQHIDPMILRRRKRRFLCHIVNFMWCIPRTDCFSLPHHLLYVATNSHTHTHQIEKWRQSHWRIPRKTPTFSFAFFIFFCSLWQKKQRFTHRQTDR